MSGNILSSRWTRDSLPFSSKRHLTPSDVAIRASMSRATTEAKRFSNYLTGGTSSSTSSITSNNTSGSRTLAIALRSGFRTGRSRPCFSWHKSTRASCLRIAQLIYWISESDGSAASAINTTRYCWPPIDGFPSYFSEFRCHTWTVLVPVARQYPTDITETVFVKWNRPDCRSCERSGGSCRLRGSTGSHVECFGKHGVSTDSPVSVWHLFSSKQSQCIENNNLSLLIS